MRTVKEHDARKNEIIDTAAALFTDKGYDQCSINDILNSIGIAKGTFYHYFKSKEDVLDAEGMPVRMVDRITHEQRNQRNIDDIVETARTFFGHWLGNQLRVPRQIRREDGTTGPNNASGIYKYLPGAVRVAISDCGWFTAHPNQKMLDNLRYIYALNARNRALDFSRIDIPYDEVK